MLCVVEVQVREDAGDGDGVGDVGIAGAALLTLMRVGAEGVRVRNQAQLLLGQVVDLLEQAAEPAVAAGQRQALEDGGGVVHGLILAPPSRRMARGLHGWAMLSST